MQHSQMTCPDSQSIAEARPVSRPRFARRVRGRRALTLAFAPRLILQPSGGCQISISTDRAPPKVEPLLMAIVLLHIETVQENAVGGDLLPRRESRFQIIMLECRRHAVDFAFRETMPCAFGAPLRDGLTDVCGYFTGLVSVQFEISGHLHC